MRIKALCGGAALGFVLGTLFFRGITAHTVSQAPCSDILIPRDVLFGNPDRLSPQISPDGTKLAYIAPYNGVLNVWVRTLGLSDDKVITHDTNRGIRTYLWQYDNQGILYLQDNKGDENWNLYAVNLDTQETKNLTPYPDVSTQLVAYSKECPQEILVALNKEQKELHDVYTLNLTTGELDLVLKNPGDVIGWHADDWLQVRGMTRALADGGRTIEVRKNHKTKWHELITWSLQDSGNSSSAFIGFDSNGRGVYLKDASDSDTARLVHIDIASKKKTVLAHDHVYDAAGLMTHPDTKQPLAAIFVKARKEFIILDPAYADDFATLRTIDRGDLAIINHDNAFNIWVVAFIKDDGPVAYYVYNRTTKQVSFLFYNQQDLANYKLAPMRSIEFPAADGLMLHGYLTTPTTVASEQKAPLVLLVHGGPWLRDTWGFDAQAQWFANRGMSCLQINYRGSTGYGKKFKQAGNKQWGGKMHQDLVDAVSWAVANGYADPKKVIIFGGSYGGYAALAGATFTPDLFCCAVDMVGPSNLISFLQSIPPYWRVFAGQLKEQVGDIQLDEQMLKERSPLFKAHAIKIPLFIAQGKNDPRVKQEESEQIVAALRENNITHEYMLFEDEGHGLAKPENRLKFYAAVEKFLAQHVGCRYQS